MDSSSAAELLTAGASPQEVAARCKLAPEFVQQVAGAIGDPAYQRRSMVLASDEDMVLRSFRRIAPRYLLFVGLSSMFAGGVLELTRWLDRLNVFPEKIPIGPGITMVVIIIVLALQALLYAHMGEVKRTLLGYVAAWVGLFVIPGVITFVRNLEVVPALIGAFVSFFVFGSIYFMIMVPSAALGGYAAMRRQSLRQTQLSRQQMLERLFELKLRRSGSATQQTAAKSWLQNRFFSGIARRLYQAAAISGAVVGSLTILLYAILDPTGKFLTGNTSSWMMAIQLGLLFISVIVLVVLSLAAANPARALLAAFIYAMVPVALYALPVRPFGPEYVTSTTAIYGTLFGLVFYNIIAIGVSLATMTHLNRVRQDALAANQADVLDQEIAQLQEALSPPLRRICVMDVDAYQSSRMKQESDVFESEWSFREYQALITRVTGRHLGVVHSTAGDGAIVGFPSSADALNAAIALQAEIAVFNQRINRLAIPFRIRIGLHTGQVQGNLDEIQFTEVIDVAAHVQKAVPVGTIGLTQRTREHLDPKMFSPLSIQVDGYDVYIVDHVRGPQP